MVHQPPGLQGVWTVAGAKARLSESLRLEGPQHIGTRRRCAVVAADDRYAKVSPRPVFR